jgi:hypothetical protein
VQAASPGKGKTGGDLSKTDEEMLGEMITAVSITMGRFLQIYIYIYMYIFTHKLHILICSYLLCCQGR